MSAGQALSIFRIKPLGMKTVTVKSQIGGVGKHVYTYVSNLESK